MSTIFISLARSIRKRPARLKNRSGLSINSSSMVKASIALRKLDNRVDSGRLVNALTLAQKQIGAANLNYDYDDARGLVRRPASAPPGVTIQAIHNEQQASEVLLRLKRHRSISPAPRRSSFTFYWPRYLHSGNSSPRYLAHFAETAGNNANHQCTLQRTRRFSPA